MEHSQVIDLTEKPFRVGPWIVAPDRHEWRAGEDVRRVPPRLMLLLRCLARAAGKTVSRESLLDIVWERRVLNDEVLSRSIADLRQALDDDAREPRFIKTIPKLGYCLIAEIQFNLPDESTNVPGQVLGEALDAQPSAAMVVSGDRSTSDACQPAESPRPGASSLATPVHSTAQSPFSMRRRAVMVVLLLILLVGGWFGRALLPFTPTLAPVAQTVHDAAALLRARPVTSTPELEFSPRLSGDGQWLAYAKGAPSGSGSHLMLRSRDGTAQREFTKLSAASDVCPVFVGTDLIWTRHRAGRCELLKQALLGDTPHVLAACAPVRSCPDISMDTKYLVYTAAASDAAHGHGLAVLNLQTGESWALTTPQRRSGHDVDPRFAAPAQLSFIRGEETVQSLWQLGLTPDRRAQAQAQRLPLADSMIFGQAYLPDGRLLLASDLLGFRALLKLTLDQPLSASNPELIGARGARFPDVAQDGSVVYELASYDANLWLYRGDAKPQRLTPSNRYESNPVLSPDAKTLIYQSNERGLEAIFSIQLDSDPPQPQQLNLHSDSRWAHPAFRRGSDALWLTRYGPEHTEVWQYLPGAPQARQASGFPPSAHDASDDVHGAFIWYLSGDAPPVHLMRRAKDGAQAELIASDVLSYRLDPRGLFLVYQHTPNQLWHCPTPPEMRECTTLPLVIARGYARHWALSDRGLYFVAEPIEDEPLRWSSRFDFATQKITTLSVPAPSTPAQGMAVARDESLIIIAKLDDLAIDLHAWWAKR